MAKCECQAAADEIPASLNVIVAKPICKDCFATRQLEAAERWENTKNIRMAGKREALTASLESFNIPKRVASHALNFSPLDDTQKENFKSVKRALFANEPCTISGTAGSGKTTVAVAAAVAAYAAGYAEEIRFVSCADIVANLYAADSTLRAHAEKLINSRPSGILILDDLSPETVRDTPTAVETLQRVVNRWYADEAKILVTTNFPKPADMGGVFGIPMASRLASGIWLQQTGCDYRLR